MDDFEVTSLILIIKILKLVYLAISFIELFNGCGHSDDINFMVFQECIVEYGSLPGEHLDMIMISQIMILTDISFQGNVSKVTRCMALEYDLLNC